MALTKSGDTRSRTAAYAKHQVATFVSSSQRRLSSLSMKLAIPRRWSNRPQSFVSARRCPVNEAELGVVLKRLLEESRHSEWELSRRANVKASLVSAALKGSGSVPLAAWCRLAHAFEHELTLAPLTPLVRAVGPIDSVVDVALRRIGRPLHFSSMDSRGRVTIPSAIRAACGLQPGDVLQITVQAPGAVALAIKRPASRRRICSVSPSDRPDHVGLGSMK
jgi:AbrB family looped-hinge helix DNA binding protein